MTVEAPRATLDFDIRHREIDATMTLAGNDRGSYTAPHHTLYRGQWLWDSAFVAIGLRHSDPQRAGTELLSLERGQWPNGMIPNIIFEPGNHERLGHLAQVRGLHTSGVTQPPLLADAGRLVGEKLPADDRQDFYSRLVPMLHRYHPWIYRDRTHGDGLFAAVHPYETGMDNSPPWMQHMETLDWGFDGAAAGLATRGIQGWLRRDTRLIAPRERSSPKHLALHAKAQWSLIKNNYRADQLRARHPLHVQDVLMNSALVHNNHMLQDMARDIGHPLDDKLLDNMRKTENNFDLLWSEPDGQYLARDAITGRHLRPMTITSLFALYSGIVPGKRAAQLATELLRDDVLNLPAGLATVPANDPSHKDLGYWEGASWSSDWIAIEGLQRAGLGEYADEIRRKNIATIAKHGMREYFSAQTGRGGGINNFSWTAGVYLDLLAQRQG